MKALSAENEFNNEFLLSISNESSKKIKLENNAIEIYTSTHNMVLTYTT